MRQRFAHAHVPVKDTQAFQSGEEAWFWFIRCQRIRHEGAKSSSTISSISRPCDPDDIYRIVLRLHRQGKLTAQHLRTLSQYGLAERVPDARCPDEMTAARLWSEAIDRLEDKLKAKGIVFIS